ncbi:3'-5' exonuclease [Calycomorphotria hydatis]|uniref:Sporulation inhibitor KapD n=1 Tax=Calycomorphotria hydatis TaxID=2528027 RepID=A0A517T504_9PLAN|nr:3'-5' exonuclease [Calycomorphotria hydatis]QDT63462.1 sporulation inhibitor KapD [Calycomorphotria hydatis]
MHKYQYAVILDFESTCDDIQQLRPQEVIEFPSVLLSLETGDVVDEFEKFVRPHHHPTLTEFCRKLTSIRQCDVDDADSFPQVMQQHLNWLLEHGVSESNGLIVTCGDWDLGTMMPAQCRATVPPIAEIPLIYSRWQNIKRAFCKVLNTRKAPGMAGMLKELNLPLTGRHHRGIDDCRNISTLYQVLIERGATVEATKEVGTSVYSR